MTSKKVRRNKTHNHYCVCGAKETHGGMFSGCVIEREFRCSHCYRIPLKSDTTSEGK